MVYFPREDCEVIDTWDVMGMRGTGSHDISVTEGYVPKSRTFGVVAEFEPGVPLSRSTVSTPACRCGCDWHTDANAGGSAQSS